MWIEVFKTGKIKDSNGKVGNYTKNDLEKIVNKYNDLAAESNSSLAPIVKGHPKDNEPAYGWVEKLERKGNKLLARIKDLVPEFSEELRKKMYRKVSISLYPDMMLRHIGFLGAVQPAVKGLSLVEFSGSEFSEYVYDNQLTDNLGSTQEQDHGFMIQRITDLEKSNQYLSKQFSEKKDELVDANKRLEELSYQSFVNEEKAFIDKLLKEGKMLPKEADKNLEMLVSLRDLDEGFRFSEESQSKPGKDLYQLQRNLLKSREVIVPLDEESNSTHWDYNQAETDFSDIDLNDPAARKMLHEKAAEISIRDHCNYSEVLTMLVDGSGIPQNQCK